MRYLILFLLLLTFAGTSTAEMTPNSTFIVSHNGDSGDINPGDGVCATLAGDCTFRAALEEANADSDYDSIRFLFAGNLVIRPNSPLPRILWGVDIDASTNVSTSCPTASAPANLTVTLSGENVHTEAVGLQLRENANSTIIRGLNIVNWGSDGIALAGAPAVGATNADFLRDVEIMCNRISGNRNGIQAGHYVTNLQIGTTSISDRNAITDNREAGILVKPFESFGEPAISPQTDITIRNNAIYANTTEGIKVEDLSDGGSPVIPRIIYNDIYDNGALGIDIEPEGVNLPEPNSRYNAPTLLQISGNLLRYSFHSAGVPTEAYTFQVFHSDSCDPSGYGEGADHVEEFTQLFAQPFQTVDQTLNNPLPAGKVMTIVAINPEDQSSEFSNCLEENRTLTVNFRGDSQDSNAGDGVCADSNGLCSLRAALEESNANIGDELTTIVFEIGSSTAGIQLVKAVGLGALPVVTKPIFLNGVSAEFARCASENNPSLNPVTVISAVNHGNHGLVLGAGSEGSTVQGMQFVGFPDDGIHVESDSNLIRCNILGATDANSSNGGDGVEISGNQNIIGGVNTWERNIIANNTESGVHLSDGFSNEVRGNHIGTDATGTVARPNQNGIHLSGNTRGNNIGGIVTLVAAFGDTTIEVVEGRNLIAGNTVRGIYLEDGTSGNYVGGNDIGVSADLGSDFGIVVNGTDNYIGLTYEAGGGRVYRVPNIVANSRFVGISAFGETVIIGNFIGALADGTMAGNETANGILVRDATNVLIQENLIQWHGDGINVQSSATTVISNTISYNGNDGIQFNSGASGASASGNVIHNNGRVGIVVDDSSPTVDDPVTNVTLYTNAIYDNDGLGIDLNDDGVTANDTGDADGGDNNRQNWPKLISVENNGRIVASLDKPFNANAAYTIDLYYSDQCDPSGHGEGKYYAGSYQLTAPNTTTANLDDVVAPLPIGSFATATATDSAGNTSEFSNCIPVTEHVFIVNNNGNGDDATLGDGRCAVGGSGLCTLSAAIQEANALAGGPFTIRFDLTDSINSIIPTQPLVVTTPITIDASTNNGASCPTHDNPYTLNVQLGGLLLGAGQHIMTLADGSDGSTIRGLAFVGSPSDGLRVSSDDNLVECSLFGVQVNGNEFRNEDDGIHVTGDNNIVGNPLAGIARGNFFSGNDGAGVQLSGSASNTHIIGNHVGATLDGTGVITNGYGIDVIDGSTNTTIEANVVIGSRFDGIRALDGSHDLVVIDGLIGFDPYVFTVSGNGRYGIHVHESDNALLQDNRIVDSGNHAVRFLGAAGGTVQGNFLGGVPAGGTGLGNNGSGVAVTQSDGVVIGSDAANVIVDNNGSGIFLDVNVTNTTIAGNLIGTMDGVTGQGNTFDGVHIDDTTYNTRVEGNTIAFNGRNGVRVDDSAIGNDILANSIYSNGSIGIDLHEDGATANDGDLNTSSIPDKDDGGNGRQNYPVIHSADSGTITFSLLSTPNRRFLIQFFTNEACDGQDGGEGATYLGQVAVITDSSGYVQDSINSTFAEGDVLTATATDTGSDGTSEFSACVRAIGVPTAIGLGMVSAETPATIVPALSLVALMLTAFYINRKQTLNN